MSDFARKLVRWQRVHGRHGLPWQHTRDPYLIWLSEIMLQQTQVATVIAYYERFVARFPTVHALASAPQDEVLRLWSGLGYYARARNLHRAARMVMDDFAGRFPESPELLATLPGVGRSTAAAIAVFAFGCRAAILDGNVKRVLARAFGIDGFPGERLVERRLWALADSLLPAESAATYIQGLMDLGATVCLRNKARCAECPVRSQCIAYRDGRVAELPGRRARSPVPKRSIVWLVLRRGARVLLEQRPGLGVWGGLWSFPELNSLDARETNRALGELGCTLVGQRALEPVAHAFSHFTLHAQPLLCEVRKAARAEAPGRLWLPPEEGMEQAVPAPVRALLRSLCQAVPSRSTARQGERVVSSRPALPEAVASPRAAKVASRSAARSPRRRNQSAFPAPDAPSPTVRQPRRVRTA